MLYKLDDVRYVAEVKNAEAKINAVDDVWYFKSTSNAKGNYSCNVMFRPGVNPDIALVNVQNAVKRAEKKLPSLRRSRAVSPAFT